MGYFFTLTPQWLVVVTPTPPPSGPAHTPRDIYNATSPPTHTTMPEFIKTLEEDDEFEDFPEDSEWTNKEPQVKTNDLWEEDWEDDENLGEFAEKLKEELKK